MTTGKSRIVYACDICGREFLTEPEAADCEKKHHDYDVGDHLEYERKVLHEFSPPSWVREVGMVVKKRGSRVLVEYPGGARQWLEPSNQRGLRVIKHATGEE